MSKNLVLAKEPVHKYIAVCYEDTYDQRFHTALDDRERKKKRVWQVALLSGVIYTRAASPVVKEVKDLTDEY